MSSGPQTIGPGIASLAVDHEALLVLDVDEVVLEFIGPFCRLLEENGARLHPESFRLTGNVRSDATGAALSGGHIDRFTMRLYEEQNDRQRPVDGVVDALTDLSRHADIVFLTAMTPSYYAKRRSLLDRHGLPYPMIATERGKGAVVAELRRRWTGPLIFVDDLPDNLESVRRSVPGAHLFHLMAHSAFRHHLPSLPSGVTKLDGWAQAVSLIGEALGADNRE